MLVTCRQAFFHRKQTNAHRGSRSQHMTLLDPVSYLDSPATTNTGWAEEWTATNSVPPFATKNPFHGSTNSSSHQSRASSVDSRVLKIGDTISLYMDMSEMSFLENATTVNNNNNNNNNTTAATVPPLITTTHESPLQHHHHRHHPSFNTFGFFTADGIITNRCGIVENREGEFVPSNFKVR